MKKYPLRLLKNRLWELADELLPAGEAGDYNQAMMELGAVVCRPGQPDCAACALTLHCAAFQSGRPELLPVKAPKKVRPHHTMSVGIVQRNNTFLIARRPEKGLLGGLWEFPATRQQKGETLKTCCLRGIREETGVEATIQSRFRTVKHAYTHFSVTMHAFQCDYQGGSARPLGCSETSWVSLKEISGYAFSRANRKLIDFLLKEDLANTSGRDS